MINIVHLLNFLELEMILPVSASLLGLLDLQVKISNFKKFSGVRPRCKFSTEEIRKPARDDMKI